MSDRDVYLKWETAHRTGAFKERGALNFLLGYQCNEGSDTSQTVTHVCAASAGNHALGLAYHCKRLAIRCTLVMPLNAPIVKVQQAQKLGAEVLLHGLSFDEARDHATHLAESSQAVFVPAYDHPLVIAGQSTVAHELIEQLPDFDSLISPVGGGGLLSGISIVMKHQRPDVYLMGVQSDWSTKLLYKKAHDSRLVSGSVADGIAVKSLGILTGDIIRKNVNTLTSINENQIASAMVQLLEYEHAVVEGAGAVPLVPLLAKQLPRECKKTVAIISGANVDLGILSRLVSRELVMRSKQIKMVLSIPDRAGVLHILSGVFAEQRANVLEVLHDRSFSHAPGNVDVTFVIEVRDTEHKSKVVAELKRLGVEIISLEAIKG